MEQHITETKKKTPRDFFLYLFATGALYFSAIQVIALLWAYVDHFLPDLTVSYWNDPMGSMRWAIAILVVLFPAFVGTMRFLSKDLDQNPQKRELGIRKWLIYLTLFLASVTIIVDLVTLVYNLLGGEFTARFVLKALSVLVVVGVIFAYYLFTLKRLPGEGVRVRVMLTWGSLVVMLGLIIGSFFIVGGPETNRLRRLDEQRIGDLQSIQWQIVSYWQSKERLPMTLDDLNDEISGFAVPVDPVTKASYEYTFKGDTSFELCAEFSLASRGFEANGESKPATVNTYMYDLALEYWQHGAQKTCFARTIDPELYPAKPTAIR